MWNSRAVLPGLAAALTLLAGACRDAPSGPRSEPAAPSASRVDAGPDLPRVQIGLDAEFARLAREVPGFGGMFLDEAGTPTVYLVDPGQRAAAVGALARRLGGELGARGVRLDAARVLQGRYNFLQLAQWRERLSSVLGLPGVVFTDIDERRNRLRVGAEHAAALRSVEGELRRLQIPRDAVILEETVPFRTLQGACGEDLCLGDRVRPTGGGLHIEFGIEGFEGFCTLGFSARRPRDTRRFFLTNSHCTDTRGRVEGTRIWQNVVRPQNLIGTEVADPPFFTRRPCPEGRRCRFSDAALIRYAPGVEVGFGTIMRTRTPNQLPGALLIDERRPRFFIVAEARFPIAGEVLNKMGRTSGWTQGPVVATCFDTDIGDITLFCQDEVNAGIEPGDSGSPVFRVFSGGRVVLYGIAWGAPFVFSAMENVQLELGQLSTEVPLRR